MIANISFGIIIITLTVTIVSIVMAVYSTFSKSETVLESARLSSLVAFPLLTLVVFGLLVLLVTNRFEYVYVFQTSDMTMPLYLKIAALWGGQEGSLLFWCWLLSGFTFISLISKKKVDHDLMPWVITVTSVILVFFLFLVLFFENPFFRFFLDTQGNVIKSLFQPYATIQALPDYGMGMNPLLRHPGMIVHPPMLYLGFVGFVVPYAYAMAALIKGRTDDEWIRKTQKWSLIAWLFLTIGLVLGSRWAYDVLGWGGYWAWDPVEVAALMPWLTGTAFLHSSLIQEKRGIFKHWNISLIILTFCLVIMGTFLTRSGMLSSVHAFSQSAIGPSFFIFTSIMLISSLVLLGWRWVKLSTGFQIKSYFSRETLFLINNLIFVCIFLICLIGVLFPIFSELVTGQQVTVGPPFYKQATGPLFAVLLVVMGVVPLSAWSTSNGKNLGKNIWKPALISFIVPILLLATGTRLWTAIIGLWVIFFSICITLFDYGRSIYISAGKNHVSIWRTFWQTTVRHRRKYGAYLIHIGIALMGLGIVGIEFFQTQTQVTIRKDESIHIAGYTLTYEDLSVEDTQDGREIAIAKIQVSKGNKEIAWLYPRQEYYYVDQQTVTTPGLRSTPIDDLYIVLVDWLPVSSEGASFKVYHNPLVFWLWTGTIVILLGTLFALWPKKSITVGLPDQNKEGV